MFHCEICISIKITLFYVLNTKLLTIETNGIQLQSTLFDKFQYKDFEM